MVERKKVGEERKIPISISIEESIVTDIMALYEELIEKDKRLKEELYTRGNIRNPEHLCFSKIIFKLLKEKLENHSMRDVK